MTHDSGDSGDQTPPGPLEQRVAAALEDAVKDTPYGRLRQHGPSPQADAAWLSMSPDERFELIMLSLAGTADALTTLARHIDHGAS